MEDTTTTHSTELACPADSGIWLAAPDSSDGDTVTCFPAQKTAELLFFLMTLGGFITSILIGLISLYVIKRNKWVITLLTLRSIVNFLIVISQNAGINMIWCESIFVIQILLTAWLCCYIVLEAKQLNAFINDNAAYTYTPKRLKVVLCTGVTSLPTLAWASIVTLTKAGSCWADASFANLFWIIEGPRLVSLFMAMVIHGKTVKKTLRPTEYLDPEVRSLWSSAFATFIILPFFCLANLNKAVFSEEFSLIFRSLEGGLFAIVFASRFKTATLMKELPLPLRALNVRWNRCCRRRLQLIAPGPLPQLAMDNEERFGRVVIDLTQLPSTASAAESYRFRRAHRVRRKRRYLPTTLPPPSIIVCNVPLQEFKINMFEVNDINGDDYTNV